MPGTPPPTAARHPRPGRMARSKALGLDPVAAAMALAPTQTDDLRTSLAQIPDLDSGPVTVLESGAVAVVAPEVKAPEVQPVVAVSRPKALMWRRVTFALALIGLIAAIPFLGYEGYQVISQSTEGNVSFASSSPTDPGYEAQVDPTPTAVAIQYDDDGTPNGVTFLSLAGADGGGSVTFVPLDTEVSDPRYGIDRLRTSYKVEADRPALARERLTSQVARLLNVGVTETIDLGNEGWAQLVAPVGPLQIDNPDEMEIDGVVIPTGPASLQADQVGRYLATTLPGETDLARLSRHEIVWQAWLDAVAGSGRDDAVPGESAAGIGRFAPQLASGQVSYATLPVEEISTYPALYRADSAAVNELITERVASPTAAVPGSRFTVRLLNGVSADAIPSELVRQIVSRGGAVAILGNGPKFGTKETTVVYGNPDNKEVAELMAESLGATGKVRLDREAPDTVDLTIVLGKDILGSATGTGTPGATTPGTTPTNGGN